MLSDEEKKEYIEHEILDRLYCLEENDFDKNKVDDGYIQAVLNACKEAKNLIEKQSKEIEELKEVKWYYEISRVPKDKIKAKIEEYKKQIEKMEKNDIGRGFTLGKEWSNLKAKVEFGQSLLEKE